MKKTILFAAIALPAFAAVAHAGHDDFRCGNIPLDRWMSRAQIAEHAAKIGVDVHRVEIEDGCYEVTGRSRQGHRVEILMHPQTGAQVSVDSD